MTEAGQPSRRRLQKVFADLPDWSAMRLVYGALNMLEPGEDATDLLHYAGRHERLTEFARRAATVARLDATVPFEPANTELDKTLTQLYAASRVRDYLLLAHQPEPVDNSLRELDDALGRSFPQFRPVPVEQVSDFFAVLGCREVTETTFDPALHEIITCEEAADPGAPIRITGQVWPALLIGELVFTRAGVQVSAGSDVATPAAAARSTLNWEYWRRHRDTSDDSFWWGTNSQWKTYARRDYLTDRGRVYDFDAFSHYHADQRLRETGTSTPQPLSAKETEFIKNRCQLRGPDLPDFHRHDQGIDERRRR